MPTRYELTPEAKRDIRAIWLYTSEQWGERQADRYTRLLETGMQRMAQRRMIPRVFSARYPQVFVSRCEHHDIFYLHIDVVRTPQGNLVHPGAQNFSDS